MDLQLTLTIPQAKALANQLFSSLNKTSSPDLKKSDILPAFKNIYSNQRNKPQHSQTSESKFLNFLDTNNDGNVTLVDLENGFINYFCKSKIQKLFDSDEKNFIFSAKSYSIEESLLDFVDQIDEEKTKKFRNDLRKREIKNTENYSEIDSILRKARSIFYEYDKSFSGYIERENWDILVVKLYKNLGFEQIDDWIKEYGIERISSELDSDRDGKATLSDCEIFVLKILDRKGLVLS